MIAGVASRWVAPGQPASALRTGSGDHRILQPRAAGLEIHLVATEAEDSKTLPARTAVHPGSTGVGPTCDRSDDAQLLCCGGHGRPPFLALLATGAPEERESWAL